MIVSLARANLIHDWRRHVAAIIVLVLAGLLMTIQLGFVAGFLEKFAELQREVRADIVIEQSFEGGGAFRFWNRGGMEGRHESLIWMHPAVENVQGHSSFGSNGQLELEDGSREGVQIAVLDPTEGSMTFPRSFPESLREVLETPNMIVIPRATRRSTGLELGDSVRLNGNEATVGGIVNGLGGSWQTQIFASPQTTQLLTGSVNTYHDKILVKIKDPERVDQVIAELNNMLSTHSLKARKPEETATASGLQEILQGQGMMLLGSAAFALVVGCGIASSTLRGAFLAQIREFGSLRALGVRKRHLAWIAMEQAWWTGLASVPIAAFIAYAVQAIAGMYDIAIALPAFLMLGSSALLMLVAIVAGVISLTAVTRAEPAELLR